MKKVYEIPEVKVERIIGFLAVTATGGDGVNFDACSPFGFQNCSANPDEVNFLFCVDGAGAGDLNESVVNFDFDTTGDCDGSFGGTLSECYVLEGESCSPYEGVPVVCTIARVDVCEEYAGCAVQTPNSGNVTFHGERLNCNHVSD